MVTWSSGGKHTRAAVLVIPPATRKFAQRRSPQRACLPHYSPVVGMDAVKMMDGVETTTNPELLPGSANLLISVPKP